MADFSEKLSFANKHSYKNHSIFSEDRENERKALLQGTHSKLILAWGKHVSIKKLACDALEKIPKDHQIFFISRFKNPKWSFSHPNPMFKKRCIEWLEDMNKQLDLLDYQSGIAATIEKTCTDN